MEATVGPFPTYNLVESKPEGVNISYHVITKEEV